MKQLALATLCLFSAAACAHKSRPSQATEEASAAAPAPMAVEVTTAKADVKAGRNHKVNGTVTFQTTATGVIVKADLQGFGKNKSHGFHVHENGDCSAPDFKSAGGHFNPTNQPHGSPSVTPHHAGDFGNIKSDKKGRVVFEKEFPNLSLNGAMNPLLGRSVIIHAKADDLKSQPAGDSGERIACGIIEAQ